MIKKSLIILIFAQLVITPVFAANTGYTEYDFSDEAQQRFEQNNIIPIQQNTNFTKQRHHKINSEKDERSNYFPAEEQFFTPANQKPLQGSVVTVPQGQSFTVRFDSGINSGSMDTNDRITALLADDWYYNGILIAPKGSLVYGTATYAKSAGLAYGSAEIEITFNQILPTNGNMINFVSEPIKLEAKSERAKNMSRDILVGTAISLLAGAAFTAIGGGDDWGRNLAVYGGIGALGGGIRGLMQRGNDIDIPNGADMQIILTQPLNISPYN